MHRPKRILIVDDDATIRNILSVLLRSEGYEVTSAEDGYQALAQVRCCPGPSLVLLDWRMPGMDGAEFLGACQREPHLAEMPVIVVTAEPPDVLQPFLSKATAILPKPVDFELLLTLVRQWC